MNKQKVDIVNRNPEKISDAIFESIHATMHAFRSEQYRVLRDSNYELTHMEGKILGFFARNPDSTLSDLVQHTGRDKGQLARLIKTLREQELLEPSPTNRDKRSVALRLSKTGKSVHKSLRDQLSAVAKQAVTGLSNKEQKTLYNLLEKIRENVILPSEEGKYRP